MVQAVIERVQQDGARIAIYDRHPLDALGLRALLDAAGTGIRVVGVAGGSVDEMIALVQQARPDVAIVGAHGSDVAAAMQLAGACSDVKVVILARSGSGFDVAEALRAGVAGVLTRDDMDVPALVATLTAVTAGATVLAPPAARALVDAVDVPRALLTPLEVELLTLVSEGRSNPDIGARLAMSASTVKRLVRRVLSKLQAQSRAEAVAFAIRAGLI